MADAHYSSECTGGSFFPSIPKGNMIYKGRRNDVPVFPEGDLEGRIPEFGRDMLKGLLQGVKVPRLGEVIKDFVGKNLFSPDKKPSWSPSNLGTLVFFNNKEEDTLLFWEEDKSGFQKYVGMRGGNYRMDVEYHAQGRLKGDDGVHLHARLSGIEGNVSVKRLDNLPYWFVTDPKTSEERTSS